MTKLPDTQLVREASRIVSESLTRAVLLHSQRAFLLGCAYAKTRALSFDEEALAIAALFHDLGLSDAYADRRLPVTQIGGDHAQTFMAKHGDPQRGRVIAEAILPVAAAIRMLTEELRVVLPGEHVDDGELRERDERAEQEYARRAEGVPAARAAAIAAQISEERVQEIGRDKAIDEPLTSGRRP